MNTNINMNKTCNQCHETQMLGCFSKRPDSLDGYRCICKKCMARKSSKYYIRNKDKVAHFNMDTFNKSFMLMAESISSNIKKEIK